MERKTPSMMKKLAWLWRAPAVVLATALLLAGSYFGSTHDVGAFLLSIPILALMFIGALGATVWAGSIKSQRGRAFVALALICLTPLAYVCAYGAKQEVRFLLWAPRTTASWRGPRAGTGSSRAGTAGAGGETTPSPTWSSTLGTRSNPSPGPHNGRSRSASLAACGRRRGCGHDSMW